jgi:succinate dehydrogenase/fumarate reductase flavoprotein subunit
MPAGVGELIEATQRLIERSADNLKQLRAALARVKSSYVGLGAVLDSAKKTMLIVQEDRERCAEMEARQRARRSSILDDWDLVRAAQHMIEVHDKRAEAMAEQRAANARDLGIEKRWRQIAATIRAILLQEGPPLGAR